MSSRALEELNQGIITCSRCPRLVAYRQQVARQKRRAYLDQTYWGKPLPGWGDPNARLLIVGLAPGAHGANRTGRMFTGDSSGDFLYPALHRAGFASQPLAAALGDGLTLNDAYMNNLVRCVPPENKPTAEEMAACRDYYLSELRLLPRLKAILALGGAAYRESLRALRLNFGWQPAAPDPFKHGLVLRVGEMWLVASYHPSQRNTQTGLLTAEMFDTVMAQVNRLLAEN